MPDFSVHIDPDDLARQNLATGLTPPSTGKQPETAPAAAHHGSRDTRQAARQRSGRDHAGRAAGVTGGRAYAFRRS